MMYLVLPMRPSAGLDLNNNLVISDKLAKECLKTYYTEEAAAIRSAEDLAVKNPTVQFVVMGPRGVYETLVPKVIRKKLNEHGEVVLDNVEVQA